MSLARSIKIAGYSNGLILARTSLRIGRVFLVLGILAPILKFPPGSYTVVFTLGFILASFYCLTLGIAIRQVCHSKIQHLTHPWEFVSVDFYPRADRPRAISRHARRKEFEFQPELLK